MTVKFLVDKATGEIKTVGVTLLSQPDLTKYDVVVKEISPHHAKKFDEKNRLKWKYDPDKKDVLEMTEEEKESKHNEKKLAKKNEWEKLSAQEKLDKIAKRLGLIDE